MNYSHLPNPAAPARMLPLRVNIYQGVELLPELFDHFLPDAFADAWLPALNEWTMQGYRLVWLRIPIERAEYIPVATRLGFTFHHSQPEYAMMVYRLAPDALIPGYATHFIGVGGVVLTPERELLVVSERHRRSEVPHYKLPGGALHAQEHLADAAMREVLEETGVHTRFDAMICLRQWHGYRYGKSDIYFIARLHPLTRAIQIQEDEIEECFWMPVDDYLAHPYVSPFNRQVVQTALTTPGLTHHSVDGYDDPTAREFFFPG